MKTFWSWLRSIFGHKSKAVPAPEPTKPILTHPPSNGGTSTPSSSAPVLAPQPQPFPVVTPAPTPIPVPVAPVPDPVVPTVPPVVVPPSPVASAPPPAPSPAPVVLPAFSDDFSQGKLDTGKWIPSTWSAPGGIPHVHNGVFSTDALDFSHGCLRIKVSQTKNPDGSTTSQGGELQSRQTFGFGTYEWILRASSTSPTPEGSGKAVSGQISSGFIFQQDQGYTEIDSPEIEGDKPDQLSWTTWTDDKTKEYTATEFLPPDVAFHSYKAVWSADGIDFYVDGVFQIRHRHVVPHVPAYAMINHWGTNSQGWGGLATPGVDRYMFVKKFSFTPA